MFASQSEFNEHKNKSHENEIDVIRTKLEESLNSNFNQNFKSEIAKKIILN